MRTVLRTTSGAVARTGDSVDLVPTPKPRVHEATRSYAVGAAIEGPLVPAFADTPAGARASRVFVLASAQFLANPFVRALPIQGPEAKRPSSMDEEAFAAFGQAYTDRVLTSAILVLKNTLDWMTLDEDLMACLRPPKQN
jgi:hypothetical protein